MARKALLVVLVALGTVVMMECSVAVLGLDDRLVARSLYIMASDDAAHRASATEGLLYELRPGAEFTSQAAWPEGDPVREDFGPDALEPDGSRYYDIEITEHGTRGPSYPAEKPDGVFRVHFFGASTLYGAGVHNNETMAWYLEEALRESDPGRDWEVWNYGTSGYVLSQMAILARRELVDHAPDLIIVLHTNNGRRPFFEGLEDGNRRKDFSPFFEASPELWRENFMPQCEEKPRDLTRFMPHSALVRAGVVALVRDRLWDCPPDGDERRHVETMALIADGAARDIGLLWVAAAGEPPNSRDSIHPDLTVELFWSLQLEEQEPVFYDGHPTPRILRQHAYRLAAELRKRGLVPERLSPQAPPPPQEAAPSASP